MECCQLSPSAVLYQLPPENELFIVLCFLWTFHCGSYDKESACNAGNQVWSLGQEHPLEKGVATHFSILARRIPWTEKTGGLTVPGVTKSQTRLSD